MKLLAERENGGILVRLYWDNAAEPDDDVVLKVRDLRAGNVFVVRPPRERALHAFYHPGAYAPAAVAA
jgi:hypothetical protein